MAEGFSKSGRRGREGWKGRGQIQVLELALPSLQQKDYEKLTVGVDTSEEVFLEVEGVD